MLDNINILELKQLENINIIDIRSYEKYNTNHINGAIHIDFDKILIYPEKYLDKSKKYYIYCQTGVKSSNLCKILKNNGFNVVNILGGYEAWLLDE